MQNKALEGSQIFENDHFWEPSGNLPGTFQETFGNLSGTFRVSSESHLETFGNISGAVTAVRFHFRVASRTSSGFPSGSNQDPNGNANFEAMI